MIQTLDKVLGEANDPNTVIATGTLSAGELIVGAGNKGIKTINVGTKKLLHTDNEAKLAAFDFNTPNKYVCTDSNGNLILRDKPQIIPITLMMANLEDYDGWLTLNTYTPKNIYGLAIKFVDWLSGTGEISLIEITKSDSEVQGNLVLAFSGGLTIQDTTNIRVILTLETETLLGQKPSLSRNVSLSDIDETTKVEILNVADTLNECSRYYITLNKVISVPAGQYTFILVPIIVPAALDQSDNKCYVRVSGCLIIGE